VYETNPQALEALRNNIYYKISTTSGKELQKVNNVFPGVLSAFSQDGNIFSTCCNIGEFLLKLSKGYDHSKSFSCFLH
jgi:hypothetical protein